MAVDPGAHERRHSSAGGFPFHVEAERRAINQRERDIIAARMAGQINQVLSWPSDVAIVHRETFIRSGVLGSDFVKQCTNRGLTVAFDEAQWEYRVTRP